MTRPRYVYACCGAIVARHASTCELFTPTGNHKLTVWQRTLLEKIVFEQQESLAGLNEHASARALARRGLVRLGVGTVLATYRGVHIARVMSPAKKFKSKGVRK